MLQPFFWDFDPTSSYKRHSFPLFCCTFESCLKESKLLNLYEVFIQSYDIFVVYVFPCSEVPLIFVTPIPAPPRPPSPIIVPGPPPPPVATKFAKYQFTRPSSVEGAVGESTSIPSTSSSVPAVEKTKNTKPIPSIVKPPVVQPQITKPPVSNVVEAKSTKLKPGVKEAVTQPKSTKPKPGSSANVQSTC